MPIYSNHETRRYDVVEAGERWAVGRNGQQLCTFATREIAVAYACRAASEDAVRGWLGVVTVETMPPELHCYTPSRASRDPARSYPRLVSSR